MMESKRIVIMGAAGRDFHVFNTCYRDETSVEVVAFTAAQIPDIDGRRYPPSLAGSLYPKGIPIEPESALPNLIANYGVDEVVFAYSDVSYTTVREKESLVEQAGATFRTFNASATYSSRFLRVILYKGGWAM